MSTAPRLLALLGLLQSRREWAGAELAARLETGERTVRRDIDELRAMGYAIEATRGVGGGYRLGAGATLPPLLLEPEEAVAIAVGLRSAAVMAVTGIDEASVGALRKLEQMLPDRWRRQVAAIERALVPLGADARRDAVDVDVVVQIAGLIRDSQSLRMTYTHHDGTESRRTVEPHRIVHSARRWYLVAWDPDRDGWRTFRVDRIRSRPPHGPRFVPKKVSDAELQAFTARSITQSPYRHQCRVTVMAPIEVVRTSFDVTVVQLERDTATTTLLRAGSNSLEEMALYLGLCGHELEVHEPAELKVVMLELAARLGRAGASA